MTEKTHDDLQIVTDYHCLLNTFTEFFVPLVVQVALYALFFKVDTSTF